MPVYADARTLDELRRTFAYVFEPARRRAAASRSSQLCPDRRAVLLGAPEIVPVPLCTARGPILGFRFGGSRT